MSIFRKTLRGVARKLLQVPPHQPIKEYLGSSAAELAELPEYEPNSSQAKRIMNDNIELRQALTQANSVINEKDAELKKMRSTLKKLGVSEI